MEHKHVLGQEFYERAADTMIGGSPEERLAAFNQLWGEYYAACNSVEMLTTAQNQSSKRIPVFDAILDERARQDAKWGFPQANTYCEWASILGEEFGELAKELNELNFGRGDPQKMISEAVQVAAVAVSIIVHADITACITEGIRKIRNGREIF